MQSTDIQLKRLAKSYQDITKEPVECQQICSTMYVYGSEIACLRLCYKMNLPEKKQPRVAYSENLSTWFFSFDMNI